MIDGNCTRVECPVNQFQSEAGIVRLAITIVEAALETIQFEEIVLVTHVGDGQLLVAAQGSLRTRNQVVEHETEDVT